MEDVSQFVKYFKYVGDDPGHNVFVGEVVPGRIYPVYTEMQVQVLTGHPDWKEATEKQYNAQTTKEDADAE